MPLVEQGPKYIREEPSSPIPTPNGKRKVAAPLQRSSTGRAGSLTKVHCGDQFYTLVDGGVGEEGKLPGLLKTAELYNFRNQLTGLDEFPIEVVIYNYLSHTHTCLNGELYRLVYDGNSGAQPTTLSRYTLIAHEDLKGSCRVSTRVLHNSPPRGSQSEDTLTSKPDFEGNFAIYPNARHQRECDLQRNQERDWVSHIVVMKAGLFHPKIYLLRFDSILRVVISSRNLEGGREFDVCWISDLLLSPAGAPGAESLEWFESKILASDEFCAPLDQFFGSTTLKSINTRLYQRVRNIFRGVVLESELTPAQTHRVSFIGSCGPMNKSSTFPMRALQNRVRDLNWSGGSDAKLHVTSCFVGNCSSTITNWWPDILEACQVDQHRVELIFPCWRDVFECGTMNGWAALHLYLSKEGKDNWKKFTYLRRAKLKVNEALYHIKMYARFASPKVLASYRDGLPDHIEAKGKALAWVVLGSHNCSHAAWGSFAGHSHNVEASVLLSTSSRKYCEMWQARHPFDLDKCTEYRLDGEKYYDEPYTWGRAPFKFAADARYKFNDDSGGGECFEALKRRKACFYERGSRGKTKMRRNDNNGSPVNTEDDEDDDDDEKKTYDEDRKFDTLIEDSVEE